MEIICTPSVNSCHLKITTDYPSYFDEPGTGYIEIKVYAVSPLNQEINFQFEAGKLWRYPLNMYVYPLYSNSTYFVETRLLTKETDGTRHIAIETSNAFITKRKHSDGAFDEFSDELDRIDKDTNANYLFKYFTERQNATRESTVAIIAYLDCYCGLNPSRRIVPKRFNPDDNELLPSGLYKYGLLSTITVTGDVSHTIWRNGYLRLDNSEIFLDPLYMFWQGAHYPAYQRYWQYLDAGNGSVFPDPLPDDYFVDQSTGFFPFLPRIEHTTGFYADIRTYRDFPTRWNDNTGTIEFEIEKALYNILIFVTPNDFFESRANPKELVKIIYNRLNGLSRPVATYNDYNYITCLQRKACYWYQRLAKKPCKRGMPLWEYLRYTV